MYCTNCGQAAEEGDRFCAQCGKELLLFGPPPVISVELRQNTRSALVAGTLAFFLGGFGIHNFYLGQKERGIAKLVVSLVLGLPTLFIAPAAMYIWALAETMGRMDEMETNC